ncbi:hypothetical protein HDV00_003625 [Rhizophlyctis rosea]|nr:hypothetical protein HDV00_003625 [Rhizophlyctis rosea]
MQADDDNNNDPNRAQAESVVNMNDVHHGAVPAAPNGVDTLDIDILKLDKPLFEDYLVPDIQTLTAVDKSPQKRGHPETKVNVFGQPQRPTIKAVADIFRRNTLKEGDTPDDITDGYLDEYFIDCFNNYKSLCISSGKVLETNPDLNLIAATYSSPTLSGGPVLKAGGENSMLFSGVHLGALPEGRYNIFLPSTHPGFLKLWYRWVFPAIREDSRARAVWEYGCRVGLWEGR